MGSKPNVFTLFFMLSLEKALYLMRLCSLIPVCVQRIYNFPGKFLSFLGPEIVGYLAYSVEKREFRRIHYFNK